MAISVVNLRLDRRWGCVCGEIHCKSQNFLLNRWKAVRQSYRLQLPLDSPPLLPSFYELCPPLKVLTSFQCNTDVEISGGTNLWPSRDKKRTWSYIVTTSWMLVRNGGGWWWWLAMWSEWRLNCATSGTFEFRSLKFSKGIERRWIFRYFLLR